MYHVFYWQNNNNDDNNNNSNNNNNNNNNNNKKWLLLSLIVQSNFETRLQPILSFKAYDACQLCSLQISNKESCILYFEVCYFSLVKTILTQKKLFFAVVQINLKTGLEPILSFKANDVY